MTGTSRIFGPIRSAPEGTSFATRAAAAEAGVHKPRQAGISGGASEGADSIVVSGGYEDDADFGDEIIYTGHGGNEGGKQVADQSFAGGNMALAVSADRGLPVRVLRGARGDRVHSPASGYRYDGLYYVESYWREVGRSGFAVWRFRLIKSPAENSVSNPRPSAPPSGNAKRAYSTTQRLIRNTAVTQWVKELYDYHCQICNLRIETPSGPYAEGAHLRPVGKPHNGLDSADNVLCLCPNDHVRFDRGLIGLDGAGTITEIETAKIVGKLKVSPTHSLDASNAEYHWSMHQLAE